MAIVANLGEADPAFSAMDSGASKSAAPDGDGSYAAGRAAFEQGDWAEVVRHMTEVVRHKPWHDDAHNALGFAYRQLGDYLQALRAACRRVEDTVRADGAEPDCEEWAKLNAAILRHRATATD